MRVRFVKDYVLFIEGASFFSAVDVIGRVRVSSERWSDNFRPGREKKKEWGRAMRLPRVLWIRRTSKSAVFMESVHCKTAINLQQVCIPTYTAHTLSFIPINSANLICMSMVARLTGSGDSSKNVHPDGWRWRGRVETMSCCYCFN